MFSCREHLSPQSYWRHINKFESYGSQTTSTWPPFREAVRTQKIIVRGTRLSLYAYSVPCQSFTGPGPIRQSQLRKSLSLIHGTSSAYFRMLERWAGQGQEEERDGC